VIVANSGCGDGVDWRSLAFSWRAHQEETPHGYRADCGPDFTRTDYDTKLIRYFEDSTWLTAGAGAVAGDEESEGLTPANVRAMTRCGVDLFGFDQLQPGDGRNEAAVWSWAEDQPGRGDCAEMRADGRWASIGCKRKLRAACRLEFGSWTLTGKPVTRAKAAQACATEGAAFDVPQTGYDNDALKQVAAGRRVLLKL
jgi:hypothetical protein